MTDETITSAAFDASQSAPQATLTGPSSSPDTTASSAAGDADAAQAPHVAALANDLTYTLTVGQARELFAAHSRKVPAERTIQTYCGDGILAAQKIRTSFGAEWLINEESLLEFIAQQPIVTAAVPATPAKHEIAVPLHTATASPAVSDAGDAAAAQASLIGERRTLAEVLIENAKLLAQIEGKEQAIKGKEETIAELKDDRAFLREEVREARQQRKDIKDIASRMLTTMENIAIAGKLPPSSAPGDNTIIARVIEPDREGPQA